MITDGLTNTRVLLCGFSCWIMGATNISSSWFVWEENMEAEEKKTEEKVVEEEEKALILATHLVPHSAEQPLMMALVPYHWVPHSSQRNQNLFCFSVPSLAQLQQPDSEEKLAHLQGQLFF
jgi:hypothetical protein